MGSFPLSVKLKALNMAEKKHMSVVICGHVDSGKSTTTGRLLFELGGVPEREMEKLKAEAEKLGKGSFAFAFYMDTQKDERERGVTIKCTTKEFFTDRYHYSIIDAPGHRDFIKNMISGAAQADVGVLMVPADGNFVVAIQKGDHKAGEVQGQTRQHARLINLLGVKQLIVCVNKMDAEPAAGYKKERYDEIMNEMKLMLIKVGWPKQFVEKRVPVIPISGWCGDNLLEKSKNMAWWEGMKYKISKEKAVQVNTLKEALDIFVQPAKRDLEHNMRLPLSGVYKIKGVGDGLTGRVEQGAVRPGEEVKFLPTHTDANACTGKVFTVEMHHKRIEHGAAGDNIGMNVKALNKENMPRVGDVMVQGGRFPRYHQELLRPGADPRHSRRDQVRILSHWSRAMRPCCVPSREDQLEDGQGDRWREGRGCHCPQDQRCCRGCLRAPAAHGCGQLRQVRGSLPHCVHGW